jgi:hypothetical protein
MPLNERQLRAQHRHRQRGRPQERLIKAITAFEQLPDVFTSSERDVIKTRFATLMRGWLIANGELPQ